MYDKMNQDVCKKLFAQVYADMDHVGGSGICSTIARKVVGAASKGVAGITTKQVANKARNVILDGTSSAVRKRTEKMVDDIINNKKKKKKKQHTNLHDMPLGRI